MEFEDWVILYNFPLYTLKKYWVVVKIWARKITKLEGEYKLIWPNRVNIAKFVIFPSSYLYNHLQPFAETLALEPVFSINKRNEDLEKFSMRC